MTDDELVEVASALKEVRREAADLKKRENALRDRVLRELQHRAVDRALTASGAPLVHLERQHRRGVNKDRLEAMFPEVFEACLEESEVVVLKVDL